MQLILQYLIFFISFCFVSDSNATSKVSHSRNTTVNLRQNIVKDYTTSKQQQAVDLNTANIETLQTLKGIGPKKAQVIIDYRTHNGPFHSVQELTKVEGISENFLAKLLEKNPDMIYANQ